MYDLEPGGLVTPNGGGVSDITRLPFPCGIFDDDVARLEDFYWKRVRAVLSNGLQEPGNERGTHDLEFERFGIGDLDDCLAVVNMVEPLKVLLVRALKTELMLFDHKQVSRTRIRGRTSTHPASAHSLRTTSLN